LELEREFVDGNDCDEIILIEILLSHLCDILKKFIKATHMFLLKKVIENHAITRIHLSSKSRWGLLNYTPFVNEECMLILHTCEFRDDFT
jgi:hypothetical protein